MKTKFKMAAGVSGLVLAAAAAAQVGLEPSSKAALKMALVTAAEAAKIKPTPTPTPVPTPVVVVPVAPAPTPPAPVAPVVVAPPPAAPVLAKLAPLDLSDMWLWHWDGKWMGSEWDNGNSPIPWRYNHISQPNGGDTYLTLDAGGSPQLQALNGTPAYSRGLWEADVTVPKLRDGVVVAPLWLYDPASRDEIDFEFPGRGGIDVTMHAYVNGVHQQIATRLYDGQDLSGQRHRFGIKVDEAAGYVEMYIDGKLVKRWDRKDMTFFVSHPVKPLIEMWAGTSYFSQWAGRFGGFGAGESMTMTVHGYGYTAIP
ncbi:family 16 glycosylhydrolase [uncultured Sphingomonas sp.]|uniref:family 16 glycosylhydrolase n=1 Tax=uncultured Sphingomonas sp. TaxID=158754 RepID=UPI0035CC0F85